MYDENEQKPEQQEPEAPEQQTQQSAAEQQEPFSSAAGQNDELQMNDIDSIVLENDSSSQPNNQARVRQGWSDQPAAAATQPNLSQEPADVPKMAVEGEDDEAAEVSGAAPRKPQASVQISTQDQQVSQDMLVDEAVEAGDPEEQQEPVAQVSAVQSSADVAEDAGLENIDPQHFELLANNVLVPCREITQTIRNNTEPIEEIESFVDLLEKHTAHLIYAIRNILKEELSHDIIKALKEMTMAMLDEQIILKQEYLVAIFQFFRVVIVNYYTPLIHRLDFNELIDLILNERQNLHQSIQPNKPSSRRNATASKSLQQIATEDKRRDELREALNFEAEKRVYARIESEAQWRQSLQVSDYLDATAHYKTPNGTKYSFIIGWSPAKVLAIDENHITVGFLGCSPASNLKLNLNGPDIAPFKTFAENLTWREELKDGDLIDACDDYGSWYRSTLNRRYVDNNTVDCDGNPIEMLHIVCRYPDPKGQKEKNGIKYNGWLRDEFDLYVEKMSISTRPFKGYSAQYFNVAPEDMKYDLEINDQEDQLFQTTAITQYANHRKYHFGGIKFMGTIIDDFGLKGGFTRILEFFDSIRDGKFKTTVEHVGHVMVFTARTLPLWTREFMCQVMESFVDKFIAAIGTKEGSNPLNQPHTRGHINILINNYHMLLRRYFVPKKHHQMLNHINSLVGCSLLRLENLEKRIFGIKLISDQISNLPYMEKSKEKKEEIVDDLMTLDAFAIIFSSKNYHQQILQRAEDVIRLFAQTQSLTPDMIAILWETRQMDETACISVYNIIGECVAGMQKEIIFCIVDKVREITPSQMQLRDVELLYTIGRSRTHTDESKYCADALWDIVFKQQAGFSKQVLTQARKKLCEMIRFFLTEVKVDFITRSIDQISDPTVISLQVLKIFFKTISWLPRHSSWNNNNGVNMRAFVTELVTDSQIIEILLQDLQSYKEKVLQLWSTEATEDNSVFNPRNIQTFPLFTEGYTHEKNLEVRLNGILYILEQAQIQGPRITADQLQRLWDILIVQTKMPGDQRAFFRLFRQILQERDWVDQGLVRQFFEEKIEQNHQIVNEISLDGFLCIQTMFLYINEFENSINIIKQPVEEKKSSDGYYGKGWTSNSRRNKNQRAQNQNDWQITSARGQSAAKGKGKLEFRVHKHPNQLRGIEILWLLFQKGPSRDLELLTQVVAFLAQVYHSISRVLGNQKKSIYFDFVHESMLRLKSSLQDETTQGAQKRDLVKNTMSMLVHSLSDTEVAGSAGIRPHFNINASSNTLEELTVQSYLTREGKPKYFSFTVDNRMTVWEFIDIIANKLNLSPRKIKLQRIAHKTVNINSKQPEFTCYTHCNTLQEMNVENGEEFTVMRNVISNEKVPLINPQSNQMVPDVRIVFESWFDRFSKPSEEFEDAESLTEDKYMDKASCVLFMTSTVKESRQNSSLYDSNSGPVISENSKEILQLFKDYDLDEDGRLTRADFLRFYQNKCESSQAIVWQNLEKHNVGKDLMIGHTSDLDVTYENDFTLTRDQADLPRYFIAANQESFNALFDLEKLVGDTAPGYEQETMESVWRLIGKLKTSPQLYLSLLKNEDLEQRLGESADVSSYRLLYSLQIIYSLMMNYQSQEGSKVSFYLEQSRNNQSWNSANHVDYDRNFPSFEESKNNKEGAINTNVNPLDQIMEDEDENAKYDDDGNQRPGKTQQSSQPKKQGNQGAAAASDEPIVLQDAAAVEQDKRQAQNQQFDRFGNQMSHSKKQIASWKGQVVQELLHITQVSDEELVRMLETELKKGQASDEAALISPQERLEDLKSQWLVDFIKNNGFQYLVQIMRSIVAKYRDTERAQILQNKAEVGTLRLAAYLIKVILISCFCSQTEDSNLAGNLQRKMSMRDDDPQTTQAPTNSTAQNNLISKQQDITNEFKQLTQIFTQESDTATKLLSSIDLNDLQDLLQSTLRIVLKKQSLITESDRQVVAECLDIWVSCITFNSELIKSIYGDVESEETTEIVTILIDQGLFQEMGSLRKQFKEAIEFMSFNIKPGTLPRAPSLFFLSKLIAQIENSKQLSYTRTPEYFELLKKLLNHYFKMREREPFIFAKIFEPSELIKSIIAQLEAYNSQESKTSIMADHTLIGLINLAQTILEANVDILDQEECGSIMNLLIKKCLFNQATNAYPGHITSKTDLSIHSSTQVNKCHTDESRNAAYSLLDTVINSNSDASLVQKLVEDFWSPFIMQLTKQKEPGKAAQDQGRSVYRFAGLKNLGCICYMNSMLQQLFNVPSFRYSLLASDDREPSDMQVDSHGRQVDNNSLHQWLKMFSFLQMTDRQEYNPIDFCFAFKENNGSPTNVRVQQDAQEFLNLGFDRLEKMLKGTPQKYLCQSVFQGQMTSLTVCKNCGNIVCTDEDFYTIQVTVKNQKNLQTSLESMVAGEKIEDYNCSACLKKVTIEKKSCIKNLPNTLIVHLNRIVFDFDTMRNVKLNDKLEFPNELNVRPFMLHQVLADMKKHEESAENSAAMNVDNANDMQQEDDEQRQLPGKAAAEDNPLQAEEDDRKDKERREKEQQRLQNLVKEGQKAAEATFEYKLVGVVIHMGVADAGHYLSYINIERDGDSSEDRASWKATEKQTWLEFNDSIVSAFDFSQMQYKAFGEEDSSLNQMTDYSDIGGLNQVQQSHNAYMLIYEKAEKKPLKFVCSKENFDLIKAQPQAVIDAVTKNEGVAQHQQREEPLSCDGTAIPRDTTTTTTTMMNQAADADIVMTQSSARSSKASQAAANSDTEMLTSTDSPAALAKSSKQSQQHMAEENKEVAQFMSAIPHSFLVYPGLIQKLYQNEAEQVLSYDEDAKEHYIELPFHQVQSFVPNQYYQQVHKDNQLFLAEKQVFCMPFFKTSAQLMEQYLNSVDQDSRLMSAEQCQKKRLEVFQVLDKVIFEMLVSGTEDQQKNLPQMTQLLFRLIEQNPQALFQLIQNRIMVGFDQENAAVDQENQDGTTQIDTTKENKKAKTLEDKVFIDMLVTGKNLQGRELAEQVLTKVMLMLFDKLDSEEPNMDRQQIEDIIQRVMHELLSLIPLEVQKSWHKLGPFFSFFHNMVKDLNTRRLNYFLRTGLIHKFIELTGRYNSQVEYTVPPFDKLVTTVCILARSQPLVIYLFGIPDEFQPTEEEVRAELTQTPISEVWAFKQIENAVEMVDQLAGIGTLDTKALLMVDKQKRSKDFYTIALKNTQEAHSVAMLIAHLCWNNYEVSRRFGKFILKGLNNTNELEVKPFVECMKMYLSLQDAYTEMRVEWLMGIASWNMVRFQKSYNQAINKVGVNTISTIADGIVEYHSTLFKTKTELEECVLRMMYNYRKDRFVRAMLAILEGVTWVIAHADLNNVLLKYLLTMDPPAYTCQRYWDWIEPHIRDHIQSLSDNINQVSSSDELETCMRIYSNIDHTKQNKADLLDAQANPSATEDGPGGRTLPEAYLMWDIINDKVIAKYPEDDNAKLTVRLHECLISCSKSRPTGDANESIQRSWADSRVTFVPKHQPSNSKYRGSKRKTNNKSTHGHKTMSRSEIKKRLQKNRDKKRSSLQNSDSQEADDSSQEGREGVPPTSDMATDSVVQEGVAAVNKDAPSEHESPETNMVPDDLQQQQEPSKQSEQNAAPGSGHGDVAVGADGVVQENPTVNMFEAPGAEGDESPSNDAAPQTDANGKGDDAHMDDGQNHSEGQDGDETENKAEQAYAGVSKEAKNPLQDKDGDEFKSDDEPETNVLKNPYYLPEDEEDNEADADNEEAEEDQRTEQYAMLVFFVQSSSRYDQKLSIVFNQENRNKVNYRMPVTDFSEVILAGKNKLVLKITKVRLDQEWGDIFDFKILVDGQDIHTGEKVSKWDTNYQHIREAKLPFIQAAEAGRALQQQNMQHNNQAADQDIYDDGQVQFGAAGGVGSPAQDDPDFGKINCPVCTFLNDPSSQNCEVCGNQM